MRRREFIMVTGGAALAWPWNARAQSRSMPVVGYVAGTTAQGGSAAVFAQGLKDSGFVDGQNVTIDARFVESQYDRLPAIMADLIQRRVALIATTGSAPAVAAKAATTTIPIVFGMGEDPVSLGLVTSMNRPVGNMTGVAYLNSAVVPKRLQLLRELVPQVKVVAALVNPKNPNVAISTKDAEDAARALGLQIHILNASAENEIDTAFASMVQLKAGALLIAPDGLFTSNANQIAVLAARHAIPATHEFRAFPAAGGLMSYGSSNAEGWRQVGVYAGRILKGEKPGDLPIMQPTKFEFVINLKTARVLGITVPPTLLVAATEVIE